MITLRFRDSVVYLNSFVKQPIDKNQKRSVTHMRRFFRNTKRTLALTVAALLALALAGCGASNAPTTSVGTDATSAAAAQSAGAPTQQPEEHKVLVAYFSATGNTKAVAETLSATLSADLFEIVPQDPYTKADLDWNDKTSRSSQEHEDDSIRPAMETIVSNLEDYDTILLGYPLWWGEAPLIVRTFLESGDFSGKTIIPFCTSSSSGFGDSGAHLQPFAPKAQWQDGMRFASNVSEADVEDWANSLF